jgi:hypothetical protein
MNDEDKRMKMETEKVNCHANDDGASRFPIKKVGSANFSPRTK